MKSIGYKIRTVALTMMMLISAVAWAQPAYEFPVPGSLKGPKYGTDSITTVQNLSVYRENFKQWKTSGYKNDAITFAIDPWRYVFLNAPLASQNVYFDGLKILEYLINKAATPEEKEKYIDTLLMVHDQNICAFGNSPNYGEGFILGKKGIDLVDYRPAEIELAYITLQRAFTLMGNSTDAKTLYYFFKSSVTMVTNGKLDTLAMFEYYDGASSVSDFNIAALKKNIESTPADSAKLNKQLSAFVNAQSNIDVLAEPFLDCENIIRVYSPKFEDKKGDIEFLRKLNALLDKRGCTSDPLYFKAAEAQYSLEPTPASALTLGKSFYKINNYTSAVKYLNEAVAGLTDPEIQADAYLVLADSYKNLNQFTSARSAANKVIELRPGDGRPYIIIGDMYMASSASCGDNPVNQRFGYIAAADKYSKAKSIDPKIADAAQQKYNGAVGGFPKTEDIFFYGYTKGSAATVGGWIGESIIIRSID